MIYTMDIEKNGEVKRHPFHLGTDLKVAESFVFEQLRNGAQSVKLFNDNKLVKIYDFRDLSYSPNGVDAFQYAISKATGAAQ